MVTLTIKSVFIFSKCVDNYCYAWYIKNLLSVSPYIINLFIGFPFPYLDGKSHKYYSDNNKIIYVCTICTKGNQKSKVDLLKILTILLFYSKTFNNFCFAQPVVKNEI